MGLVILAATPPTCASRADLWTHCAPPALAARENTGLGEVDRPGKRSGAHLGSGMLLTVSLKFPSRWSGAAVTSPCGWFPGPRPRVREAAFFSTLLWATCAVLWGEVFAQTADHLIRPMVLLEM